MTNIVIYSTCQGMCIKFYIQKYFPKSTINVIKNYQIVLENNKKQLKEFINLLQKADIFIYQHMPKKWGIYSTDITVNDNICNYIPSNCIKITIPYIYADWLWGLGKILLRDGTANFNNISNNTETEYKYINKDVIIKLKKKHNLSDILKLYDDDNIDFEYEKRKKNGINILKSKELTCDVKVSDFILANYKTHKLFTTPNHPTYIIFEEMSKQILKKLNINHNNFDKIFEKHKCTLPGELPHSKYDKKNYNFKFKINCHDNKIKNIIRDIYNSF